MAKAAVVKGAKLAVVYRPLGELKAWPRNPRDHDLEAIAGSEREFGFRDPIAVNETTREIEEGHGRIEALTTMKANGEAPPAYIEVRTDGEWLVPTLPFTDSRAVQERYALAHNRAQEKGENASGPLAKLLEGMKAAGQLVGTGYSAEDVDALLRSVALDADKDKVGAVVFAVELDEANNYVVLFFRSATDWLHAQTVLGLDSVYAKRRNGKPWSKGVGRVMEGREAMAKIAAAAVATR